MKFQQFTEDLAEKVHNFAADTFKVLLTNDAPDVALDAVKADLTSELGTGGGYTAGGAAVPNVTSTETGGVTTVAGDAIVWTASGATIGPFRYACLYNDTTTSPADALIAYWDYGSSITLQIGETFSWKPDDADTGGTIFTLT